MLERDAGKLLLVFALANCGGESELGELNPVPILAPAAGAENGARQDELERAERAPAAPALPGSDWQATIAHRIAASSFAIEPRGGRFEAHNAKHGFRAAFDARGLWLEPKEGSRALRIGGAALGRGAKRTPFEPASLALGACRADGALDAMGKCLQRLEATRGKVTELWENREDGLEHSFIVHERSEGEGELSVSVAIENAKVTIDVGGTAARIMDFGSGQSYRYAGLRAWDANGTVLAARMQAQPEGLSLVVDDTKAVYPITIDPVLAMPTWVTSGTATELYYGVSVAGAGDVNGDGFDDVLVSARGTAFLYLGASTGLQPNAAWRSSLINQDANLATTVARAGDVNHDGFDDVIVGSPGYVHNFTREGRVGVYHGSAAGLAAQPAWTFEAEHADALLGTSISTAGDVNGDGFDDVIVGAPGFTNVPNHSGRVFVFHGGAAGLASMPAWWILGPQHLTTVGNAVAGAGDVNGDGFDDVVLGLGSLDSNPVESGTQGRAVVYLGGAQGLSLSVGWTANGKGGDARFGSAVAGAGDLNGDGLDDIIVGAPGGSCVAAGYIRPFYGSATNVLVSGNTVGHHFEACFFGMALAGAGDVNGDGFDDIIVGARLHVSASVGDASVYHGSASGLSTTPAWTGMVYPSTSEGYGSAVASAGDVDGDGFSDIIVGAPAGGGQFIGPGRAFVYNGSPTGIPAARISTVESNQASSRFGVSVAYAGDLNADGFGDVIVGAPLFDDGITTNEGRVFVYHGTATGIGTDAIWTTDGNQTNAQLGFAVSGAGDVNGDGFDDIIIGSPLYDNGQTNEGRVWVYHGGTFGLAPSPAWTKEINQADARFGASVASAGDVNGDGFDDVIIGATRFDNGQTDEGRAFVYAGRATGLFGTPLWTAESNQANANFGVSVASGGDVNGDGFDDVIVGADHWDNSVTDAGRAYYYPGSSTGPAASPAWTEDGTQAGAAMGRVVAGVGDTNADGYDDIAVSVPEHDTFTNANVGLVFLYQGENFGLLHGAPALSGTRANEFFGVSVAGVGDLNGDGFDDVVIGAYGLNHGEEDEGAAFVFSGTPTHVLNGFPAFVLEGNQLGGSVGVSVSGGDINGDGLSDLIVGAHYFDNGQTDEGRVFIVY